MVEPIAKVYRGDMVESVHRGVIVVSDAEGNVDFAHGDPEYKTFWRSAAKLVQVLPLVVAGGVEKFGFTQREMAVMCASHSGEAEHVDTVRSVLGKIGVDENALQCGAHPPMHQPTAESLWHSGEKPQTIHCNCSGKHAGMLALAKLLGADPSGYLDPEHPVQRRIREMVARLTGEPQEKITLGVDGCGVPVFGLSIRAMAKAYGCLADSSSLEQELQEAIAKVTKAVLENPYMVAGTGRFDTVLMERTGGLVFAKGGAEGVFCMGIPETGRGYAMKVEDGNARAIPPVVVEMLERMGLLEDDALESLEAFHRPIVTNHAGTVVGKVEQVVPLTDVVSGGIHL